MNLKRTVAVAHKEWREIIRDRVFFSLSFVVPVVMMLLLGYGLSLDVENIFFVDANWLATGEGSMRHGKLNFSPAPDVRDYVPLISMVQAGNFCEAIDNLHVGDSFEQIPTSYPKKRHTFALEVSGESMLPRFPPGMRLIVEPEMDYQSGDFVIAKNGGDATFKQNVKDGGVWYLKPLNPQFPTLPLADAHVIGVVREAVIKFR